jgi:D-serine deaminase-like pyridoxal phosphate-dependent protein
MLNATSRLLAGLGLSGPSLVIDERRARANIAAMAGKAAASGVRLRPHFKTHQSGAVGRWFAEAGVTAVTVSSAAMAEACAEFGWRDITVGILVNPRELGRLDALAAHLRGRDGRLGLLVDDPDVTWDVVHALRAPCELWLKVDTGYGRSGTAWDDGERLRRVRDAAGDAGLRGLLTHAGHGYALRGREALRELYAETARRLQSARRACGDEHLQLSVGDTPTCAAVDRFDGVDEVRPGNFVFHDLMQLQIGACDETQLAAAAVCPVIGSYPERGRLVLHGGAVHLSKEALAQELPGGGARAIYGCLGSLAQDGDRLGLDRVLPEAPVVSLSQEHAVVEYGADPAHPAARLRPGDLALVWPVHSCLTCDLQREFVTLDGGRLAAF